MLTFFIPRFILFSTAARRGIYGKKSHADQNLVKCHEYGWVFYYIFYYVFGSIFTVLLDFYDL